MVGLTAPGPQAASLGLFGADPIRRAGATRQPSLLELMSLTDWPRFVPETLGLLLAIVLLRGAMDPGMAGVFGLPHPFWIPVLLISAQYGIMGGLFAALSASGLFIATDLPARSAVQDFYDYAGFAAVQPCAWFAAGLVGGGLRTLHMHHHARLADQLEDTKAAAEEFADRLTGVVNEMAKLEQRIATDTATISVVLDTLGAVDLSSRQTLLASFGNIFCHVAGATTFAIYLRQGEALVPCLAFEAGTPMPRAALASLPHESRRTEPGVTPAADSAPELPLRIPIQGADDRIPLGVLVCAHVAPDTIPAIVARRLTLACRALAQLLPACVDFVQQAGDA